MALFALSRRRIVCCGWHKYQIPEVHHRFIRLLKRVFKRGMLGLGSYFGQEGACHKSMRIKIQIPASTYWARVGRDKQIPGAVWMASLDE